MKSAFLIFLALAVGSSGLCDSRAWPPGPTVCSDKERAHIFIFDPVMKKSRVVGTVVTYFEWMEKYAQFVCTMRRSLTFWVEPDQAFMAKKEGHIVLISEGAVGRADYAIAVLDADHGKFVWARTLDDLFPSRKKNSSPQWAGSISTKSWLATAKIALDGQVLEITTERPEQLGMPEAEQFEIRSKITINLETLGMTITAIEERPIQISEVNKQVKK
ncbi:MAG TPA: hypothetical protein VGM64_22135 [Lacunisphaera sp.]|jgi:hypothetical protein